jgi:hypothetical protein
MTKNERKKIQPKKVKYFFDQKLQFTYPYASIKDVKATGEAFSPQKKPSSTSRHEISKLFSIFVGQICPHESGSKSGSGSTDQIESGSKDPDPKHCQTCISRCGFCKLVH